MQVAYAQGLPRLQAHGLLALMGRQPTQRPSLALAEGHPFANAGLLDGVQDVLALVRKVALEAKHNGCVLQALDAPGGRYMVDDEAVCVPYVFRVQEVDTEELRREMVHTDSQRTGLRSLLMGPPLTQRGSDDQEGDPASAAKLDEVLGAVKGLLPQVYGKGIATDQASMELQRVVAMPATYEGLACKRASVLFAMQREKEVAAHFAAEDPTYAGDMRDRVLPFSTPRFVRHSFQCPDAYVVLAAVLSEMWAGERLGNWPLLPAEEAGEAMET